MPPSPTARRPGDATATYRYLRGAMVALLVSLLLAVVLQWWIGTHHTCWLGSISAYYFTPARTGFVGALAGLGVTLIVYQGHSPEENVLLDFSGFMALLVAAVPTVPDLRCGTDPFDETVGQIGAGIAVTVPALVTVSVLVLLALAVIRSRTARIDPPRTRATIIVGAVCASVIALELVLVAVLRGRLVPVAHGVAATAMVLGAVAVMVTSASRVDERHGIDKQRGIDKRHRIDRQHDVSAADRGTAAAYRRTYLGIAAALAVLLALIVVAHLLVPGFGLAVLLAEVAVIVLFGAYWVVQTVELWSLGDEAHPEARNLASRAGR